MCKTATIRKAIAVLQDLQAIRWTDKRCAAISQLTEMLPKPKHYSEIDILPGQTRKAIADHKGSHGYDQQ